MTWRRLGEFVVSAVLIELDYGCAPMRGAIQTGKCGDDVEEVDGLGVGHGEGADFVSEAVERVFSDTQSRYLGMKKERLYTKAGREL